MILFTSGFPASGKTTFAKKLIDSLDNEHILHINPKDYYPDEFQRLTAEEQTSIGVTAWEICLEKATKAICALPNKALIIFDTCCSKSLHMRPLFMNAKLRNHHVFMVYLHADLEHRTPRTSQKLASFESKYRSDFLATLPVLKKHTDHWTMITNHNEGDMNSSIERMSKKIKSIRGG